MAINIYTDNDLILNRAKSALKTVFVADSLAMPVHWFYRTEDIYHAFPSGIKKFEDAPKYHPSSIMSLHSTQQGGRSYQTNNKSKNIIGGVIMKGREDHWDKPNRHYHHGMKAGENTLNVHCLRTLIQSIIDLKGRYNNQYFLESYVSMMTAKKPLHNDTYAESYHRGFFANYIIGNDLQSCAAKTHDTASIGGLVSIGPLAMSLFLSGHDSLYVQDQCKSHLYSTHPDESLASICSDYVELIKDLLFCDDYQSPLDILKDALKKASLNSIQSNDFSEIDDHSIVGMKYSTACYISGSWPSVLFLACKYQNDIKKGLLVNTNLGGDNVHRGTVLGFILGLCQEGNRIQTIDEWFFQLKDHLSIKTEMRYLFQSVM